MPSIFAPQPPVTNDTGAVTLGFHGAPNVLYDRTLVGDTTYTIAPVGTSGGETLSVTLRGPYAYSFESAVAINWAGGIAPTPACSARVFDRIRFEVLQDGTLLGTQQAMGAGVPVVAPAHYLDVSGQNKNASAPATAANDGGDSFLSIKFWLDLTSSYAPGVFSPILRRLNTTSQNPLNSEYVLGLAAGGQIGFLYYDANGSYQGVQSSSAISSALANVAGLWLRIDLNAGTTAIKGVEPGTAVFYTSPGGPNPDWTQLGDIETATQTGFNHIGVNSDPILFGDANAYNWVVTTSRIYEVIIENSTTVLANPDFQSQPTTASGGSFFDTSETPNVINLNTNIT